MIVSCAIVKNETRAELIQDRITIIRGGEITGELYELELIDENDSIYFAIIDIDSGYVNTLYANRYYDRDTRDLDWYLALEEYEHQEISVFYVQISDGSLASILALEPLNEDIQYSLRVNVEGEGRVEIRPWLSGRTETITTSSITEEIFSPYNQIKLKATPEGNWTFDSWTVETVHVGFTGFSKRTFSQDLINIVMDGNKEITAHFISKR